jgi:uncharacterized protein YdcH (DUF465 family)
MAREDLHFRLRIPEPLKVRIEAAAEKRQRSMTAEIVDRLDYSFDRANQQREETLQLIDGLGLENSELRDQIDKLKIENGRLAAALDESRASNFALQHLIQNDLSDPGRDIVSQAPLSSELFDKLFEHLNRLEKKIDGKADR